MVNKTVFLFGFIIFSSSAFSSKYDFLVNGVKVGIVEYQSDVEEQQYRSEKRGVNLRDFIDQNGQEVERLEDCLAMASISANDQEGILIPSPPNNKKPDSARKKVVYVKKCVNTLPSKKKEHKPLKVNSSFTMYSDSNSDASVKPKLNEYCEFCQKRWFLGELPTPNFSNEYILNFVTGGRRPCVEFICWGSNLSYPMRGGRQEIVILLMLLHFVFTRL